MASRMGTLEVGKLCVFPIIVAELLFISLVIYLKTKCYKSLVKYEVDNLKWHYSYLTIQEVTSRHGWVRHQRRKIP